MNVNDYFIEIYIRSSGQNSIKYLFDWFVVIIYMYYWSICRLFLCVKLY